MKYRVIRTERGWGGHFICADVCRFRRNTLLEYGNKKWIVSTIGRMVVTDIETKKLKYDIIGADGRYYETMAFVGVQLDSIYIDADVDQPIDFESNWSINYIGYGSDQEANDMHEKVVAELMLKIQENNNG